MKKTALILLIPFIQAIILTLLFPEISTWKIVALVMLFEVIIDIKLKSGLLKKD